MDDDAVHARKCHALFLPCSNILPSMLSISTAQWSVNNRCGMCMSASVQMLQVARIL
jgi:hypothetical protein